MNKYGPSFERKIEEIKKDLGKNYVETWDERVARQTAEVNAAKQKKLEEQDLKGAFVGEVRKDERLTNLRSARSGMH